jgi:uridylate kinase
MDQTAASICQENKIDILVFNMNKHGNMKKAVLQEPIGTLVKWEESI